jgi:inhibitor of KinA sporulation pathway (predicted exonuclease)
LIILMDLEATCWLKEHVYPRPMQEVIELAAIAVDDNLEVQDVFHTHFRPCLNPVLSESCKKFTGLSQELIDEALASPQSYDCFRRWLANYPEATILNWGPCDRFVLVTELTTKQIHSDLADHLLRRMMRLDMDVQKAYGLLKGGLYNVMDLLGLDPSGHKHCALNDTLNMLEIYRKYRKDFCL